MELKRTFGQKECAREGPVEPRVLKSRDFCLHIDIRVCPDPYGRYPCFASMRVKLSRRTVSSTHFCTHQAPTVFFYSGKLFYVPITSVNQSIDPRLSCLLQKHQRLLSSALPRTHCWLSESLIVFLSNISRAAGAVFLAEDDDMTIQEITLTNGDNTRTFRGAAVPLLLKRAPLVREEVDRPTFLSSRQGLPWQVDRS